MQYGNLTEEDLAALLGQIMMEGQPQQQGMPPVMEAAQATTPQAAATPAAQPGVQQPTPQPGAQPQAQRQTGQPTPAPVPDPEPPKSVLGNIPVGGTRTGPQRSNTVGESGIRGGEEELGALRSLMGEAQGDYEAAYDTRAQAMRDRGEARRETLEERSVFRDGQAAALEERKRRQGREQRRMIDEMDAISHEIQTNTYEEKGFWEDKSMGAKLGAALLMMAGAWGAAMSGTNRNMAAEQIQSLIRRDIERQRFEYEKKRLGLKSSLDAKQNIYSRMMDLYQDENLAAQASEAFALEAVVARGEARMAEVDAADEAAAMQQELAKTKTDMANARAGLVASLGARYQATESAQSPSESEQYVTPEGVMMERDKQARDLANQRAMKALDKEKGEEKELRERSVRINGEYYPAKSEKAASEGDEIVKAAASIKPEIDFLVSVSEENLTGKTKIDKAYRSANVVIGRLNRIMQFGAMDNSTLEMLRDMVSASLPDRDNLFNVNINWISGFNEKMRDVKRMLQKEINAGLENTVGAKLSEGWQVIPPSEGAAAPNADDAMANSR